MKGYDFGQVGGNDGHQGVLDKSYGDAGAYPPTCGQKGGSPRPLLRRGPASPNNVLEKKKKKVCMLGEGCGRLANSASELDLGQVGARGGASRGRVLPIPPFDLKTRRCTPFWPFP